MIEERIRKPYSVHSASRAFPQMETGFIIAIIKVLRESGFKVLVRDDPNSIDFGSDVSITIEIRSQKQKVSKVLEAATKLLIDNFDVEYTDKRLKFDGDTDRQFYIANVPYKQQYFDVGNRRLIINPTYEIM